MIGMQCKLDLLHPNATNNNMIFMLDCNIEKDPSSNNLSVFEESYIYIEIKWVFSVTVDTDRKIAFSSALNVLTITKDLVDTYSKHFTRVIHH